MPFGMTTKVSIPSPSLQEMTSWAQTVEVAKICCIRCSRFLAFPTSTLNATGCGNPEAAHTGGGSHAALSALDVPKILEIRSSFLSWCLVSVWDKNGSSLQPETCSIGIAGAHWWQEFDCGFQQGIQHSWFQHMRSRGH